MANEIIRGTTPTITYEFKNIDVSDITVAYLTIKQANEILVEKTLADATVGEDSLSWELTQEDTLGLQVGNASPMVNWKLSNGMRGASQRASIGILDNHKNEVI